MSTNGKLAQGKLRTPPSKPGTLHALQLRIWRALSHAETLMARAEGEPLEVQIKVLNTFCQCALTYLSSIKAKDYAVHPAGEHPYDEHH
jgi:hypothetical protein